MCGQPRVATAQREGRRLSCARSDAANVTDREAPSSQLQQVKLRTSGRDVLRIAADAAVSLFFQIFGPQIGLREAASEWRAHHEDRFQGEAGGLPVVPSALLPASDSGMPAVFLCCKPSTKS